MQSRRTITVAMRLVLVVLVCGLATAAVGRAYAQCMGFAEQAVFKGGTNGITSIAVADLDRDGDQDIVSVSFGDNQVVWYENDPAQPLEQRFQAHVVSDNVRGAAQVRIADVDGDGRLDLVVAARRSNAVIWFRQEAGTPLLFTARTVTARAQVVLGVHAADVDGDGYVDLLSASFLDDKLAWYRQEPAEPPSLDPPSFVEHVITEDARGAASVFAADLNADDRIDVLSASRSDNTIAWYEQGDPDPEAEDPEAPTFTKRVIDKTVGGATDVLAADLDRDGDLDIVAAAQAADAIYWWPNNGGTFDRNDRRTLPGTVEGPVSVFVADLNGDGAPDVLSASFRDNKIAWFESDCLTDHCGTPSFTQHVVSDTATHANDVAAADLDGGGVDVISASSVPGFPASQDRLAWYRNDGATPVPGFAEEYRIYRSADGAVASFVADLDRDGDEDVATAGRTNRIAWYASDGASPPKFTENVVTTDAIVAIDVTGADLDLDGDTDLVSASSGDGKIAWYENGCVSVLPGEPCQTPLTFVEHVIATDAEELADVSVVDLDGDGDPDILAVSSGDGKVAWYENDCGAGPCAIPTFQERVIRVDDPYGPTGRRSPPRTERILPTSRAEATGARSASAADMDGDGDPDVLVAFFDIGRIRWYENALANPAAAQWTSHDALSSAGAEIPLLGATSVVGADLDADGHTDIVVAAATARLVAWLESDGEVPPEFLLRVLASDANDVSSVEVADMDDDGDLDIVAAVPGDDVIAWFENDLAQQDPEATTTPSFALDVVANTDLALSTSVADMNGDRQVDIVAGQRLFVSWFEASGEICQDFDVNGDGILDGVELAWIGRAFGMSSSTPQMQWWGPADFNADGTIDGEDLAYLAAPGVFGVTTEECSLICR